MSDASKGKRGLCFSVALVLNTVVRVPQRDSLLHIYYIWKHYENRFSTIIEKIASDGRESYDL